jgi:hypothetical protein
MPMIDLTDAELAAVTAAIGRAVEEDPRAARLDPLRSALDPAGLALTRPLAAKSARPAPTTPKGRPRAS